jgi:hypothetical protein
MWLSAFLLIPAVAFAQPLPFAEAQDRGHLKSGFHVAVADLNHDGRPDIIALA